MFVNSKWRLCHYLRGNWWSKAKSNYTGNLQKLKKSQFKTISENIFESLKSFNFTICYLQLSVKSPTFLPYLSSRLLCFMSLRAENVCWAAVSPESYNVAVVDQCLFVDVKQKPVTEVSKNRISRKHQRNL